MAQEINIPPAGDVTLEPSNGDFYFNLSESCTVCFGPSNPADAFPDLSNQTFSHWGAQSPLFPIPPSAAPEPYIDYNVSTGGSPCTVSAIGGAVKTIHVGSNLSKQTAGKGSAKSTKKSRASAKKSAAKKPKKAASRKAAKSARKTSAKKPAKKAAPKKKSAKKAAKKGGKKAASKRSGKKSRR